MISDRSDAVVRIFTEQQYRIQRDIPHAIGKDTFLREQRIQFFMTPLRCCEPVNDLRWRLRRLQRILRLLGYPRGWTFKRRHTWEFRPPSMLSKRTSQLCPILDILASPLPMSVLKESYDAVNYQIINTKIQCIGEVPDIVKVMSRMYYAPDSHLSFAI